MRQTDPTKDSVTLSVEKIVSLIRSVRNELVKEFLTDEFLNSYYKQKNSKALSNVKREFLKRDLRELLYAGLINHIRETGIASLAEANSSYFLTDVERIVAKYSV